jgi:hypothetical protein
MQRWRLIAASVTAVTTMTALGGAFTIRFTADAVRLGR